MAQDLLAAIQHEQVWKPWFRTPETWQPWFAFLRTLFGQSLSEADLALFRQCTARNAPLPTGYTEAWLVCGRRAGKSFILALIACYLATLRDWSAFLQPGEIGYIKVLAVDRRQARVIHRYCRALLTRPPALAPLVERDDDNTIWLRNGIAIEVQTASFRSARGFTLIAALCDELAFWRTDDSANPDSEVLGALRPAMATIPNSMLLAPRRPMPGGASCGPTTVASTARRRQCWSGTPTPGR